jgi:hypothetical protein
MIRGRLRHEDADHQVGKQIVRGIIDDLVIEEVVVGAEVLVVPMTNNVVVIIIIHFPLIL